MENPELEYCVICNTATGHAGIYDDSLFDTNGNGPYCSYCYEDLSDKLKDDND